MTIAKNILLLCVIGVFLLFGACGGGDADSGNDDCTYEVTVEDIGKDFIEVSWDHHCETCITWEVGHKRTWFWGWFYSWETVNAQGSQIVLVTGMDGYDHRVTGLKSGKEYKVKVKNCNDNTIGVVTETTD